MSYTINVAKDTTPKKELTEAEIAKWNSDRLDC